jgi:Holliday junction resolvase RusA-like endonuclease
MTTVLAPERTIAFTVFGRPQQRGSKQAVLIPKRGGGWVEKNGRPIVVAKDDNENSKEWMGQVRDAAHDAFQGELIRGPVRLTVRFYFKRIKGHYRTGKRAAELRDDAPYFHASTPDLDKLTRALADSLTGVVLADDKQIAAYGEGYGKYWTTEAERAEVTIEQIDPA